MKRRDFLRISGAAIATAGVANALPNWAMPPEQAIPADPLLHLLNRITWGPRPEEIVRAQAIGYEAYLEEQLNPENIDDSEMDTRLESLPILAMNRQTASLLSDPEYRTFLALTEGMVMRAVHSKRQLSERMAEFWLDLFNIPSEELSIDLLDFHHNVIRPNALGNFRDMLFGTARSPAMLYYLDNYLNEAEHPNENYARELMELHTLGVDGGYTETDVKEVARAFTGWTIRDATETGFFFDPNLHDTGEKFILGHTLPADRGIEDGLQVLTILNSHPSTARFICGKLSVRFVSDNPPPELVESAAQVWMDNSGEIRPVLRHIFLSEAFRQSVGQKLRRPLDFFVGTLRASGTEFRERYVMIEMLQDLAQMPYGWQPPNGYPDVAGAWANSSGLLARWNVAMTLTHGAWSDPDMQSLMTNHLIERIGQPATAGELVDSVAQQVFGVPLPEAQRATFITYATDNASADMPVTPRLLAQKLGSLFGLMLASPMYQWR